MLYVRPALLAYGRHVEAVAGRNEANLVKGEWVDLGRVFDNLVLSEVFVLRTLHRRREDQLHVFLGHCGAYLSGERFAVASVERGFYRLAVFLTSITLRVRGVTFSGRPAGLR